jgi:replicative DNA helicase
VDQAELQSSADLLAALFDGIEQRTAGGEPTPLRSNRILTYLADVDAMTQGLQRGSLVVLAGSTGMGKTTLALNLARNISLHSQIPVLYGAYDSPPEELLLRLLASMCDVESGRIGAARLSQWEWPKLGEAMAKLSAAPLFWMERPAGLQAIRQRCHELQGQTSGGPGVVILDQLQLMPELQPGQANDLAPLLQELRHLAAELNVCLILLTQTPPTPELRDGHLPCLNDLPDVVAMQAYAHVIALLNRQEFWDPETTTRGEAELILCKNAVNPVGMVRLWFEPQFSRFSMPPITIPELRVA